MISYWQTASAIRDRIFIPKYYNPELSGELQKLSQTHDLLVLGDLIRDGLVAVATGDEIGKAAYGTGDIPFVRTSDISNWEIKSSPKQGVSESIYQEYAGAQDVRAGDILFVRDGTYLIGTNCFITKLDTRILYQSHILKFRVSPMAGIDPLLIFLALNSVLVKRQIRSFQFTADTIDTIGDRYKDLILPIPKAKSERRSLAENADSALSARVIGKAFIRQAPSLIESALKQASVEGLKAFIKADLDAIASELKQDTVSAEFGHFEAFWHSSSEIQDRILLPKYYDPELKKEIEKLESTCRCVSVNELVEDGILSIDTGDEIGKMAYGTGEIPFFRTSDFANWEIKHDPKQGISESIFNQYRDGQDLKPNDLLIVRDGTYLVGSSCIISSADAKGLYCGGLIKIRSLDIMYLDPYLLLAILNSYVVKRQIRTKQFTRDVIDTLGQRLREVILPIPKSSDLRHELAGLVKQVVDSRLSARETIAELTKSIAKS